MEIPEFTLPDWLENCDSDTIQKRMMDSLPQDIDKTEGGFPWDFTAPTALEVAELLQFHIPETLKLMHPMWAYGKWLDYHAKGVGTERKAANSASGILHIVGIGGTMIPAGFRFAVPTDGTVPAVEFAAAETSYINTEGYVDVEVIAVEPGVSGNVAPGTISVMAEPISGIISISNPEKITGGTIEETDDSLRERIQEINNSAEASFVGCVADYRRWAMEVPGVGDVFVIPQWDPDTPNSVKVVCMDYNGEPANEHILQAVYDYIYSDNDEDRKCPIGAILTVAPPTPVKIMVSARVRVEIGETKDVIYERFLANLRKYYNTAKNESVVKYSMIGAILVNTPGVYDYDDLFLNGSDENIGLASDEYPVTSSVEWR